MDFFEHMLTRDEAEHARVCSLPFGHDGGHWWDEEQEPPAARIWHPQRKALGTAADSDLTADAGGQVWPSGDRGARRCANPDCDGEAGHDGPHYQWVPE